MRKSIDKVNRPPGLPQDEVLDLIHTVMHQYRSQQYRVLRDGTHDITHMDARVLGFFGARPGATQKDLAEKSGRDKAQLARLVKGLRDRELLRGEADEADRRNLRLYLTVRGEAVQNILREQAQLLEARAVDGFRAEERQQLAELLGRVKKNLAAG